MIDLRKARQVLAVAQYGGFSKAAEALNITQSTLTKSVQSVERELGLVLLERGPQGARLTPEGEWFTRRAVHLVAEAEDLVAESRALRGVETGQLRIGADATTFDLIVTELVPRFAVRFPGVRIEVTAGSVDRISNLVQRGDVEIVIGPLEDLRQERTLEVTALESVAITPFVRRGHPLDGEEPPTLADLFRYPLVGPRPPEPYYSIFSAAAQEAQSPYVQPHVMTSSFSIMSRVVEQTDAFAFAFRGHAASSSFQQRFRAWEGWVPVPPISLDVAWRLRWIPSRAAEQFIAMLRHAG